MKVNPVRVLVCGVLPPPYFGHSMLYEMLMMSSFPSAFDVKFLNMHFWSYATNKKVTGRKLARLVKYFLQYLWHLTGFRPRYVLYNISFYRMPFLKDFLFCAAGIVLGRRVILHDHGQYVKELYDGLPFWQKPLLRWMLRHCQAGIIMGERVRPVYQGLMSRNRLFVVPGTAEDTKKIVVDARPAAAGLNILYFSHLSRDKGVFIAFEALFRIMTENQGLRWTFAGPIENDAVFSRLKECQSAFPGRVFYLGYIGTVKERTRVFRSADIFVFPTLRDVFGLVLLHAMAEGLPITASHEGTIPEILPDERHGLLFNKGDVTAFVSHVLALAKDADLRALMGAANRRRFEQVYNIEQYGSRMISVFREIGNCG